MEIGAMDSLMSMVGMQSASSLSSKSGTSDAASFLDNLESSETESSGESDVAADSSSESTESSQVYDVLDTNEDGFVSQDEYEASGSGLQQAMNKFQASGLGGIKQGGDSESFSQLMDMLGTQSDNTERGVGAYAQMQNGMTGATQSYSAGLDISA